MDKKKFLCHICVQIILVTVINGEIQICLNTAGSVATNYEVESEEISQLIKDAETEIKEAFNDRIKDTSFDFSILPFNFSHPAITMTGKATNVTVVMQGNVFRFFTIVHDGFEVFNITFSSIVATGWYDMNGYVGANRLFAIYGKDKFSIELFDFSIAFIANLNITETAFCVPILTRVYVADFKCNFNKIMNGDEDLEPLINGAFQAIGADAIRIIYREMADSVDPYIQQVIDDMLRNSSLPSFTTLLQTIAQDKSNVNVGLNTEL